MFTRLQALPDVAVIIEGLSSVEHSTIVGAVCAVNERINMHVYAPSDTQHRHVRTIETILKIVTVHSLGHEKEMVSLAW